MRISWQRVLNLVAAGLVGLGTNAAQALEEQPSWLTSYDETRELHDDILIRGQSCGEANSGNSAGNCDLINDHCDDDSVRVWICRRFRRDSNDAVANRRRPARY